MKNVYFVLANKSYGKALYLPYASGCLAAYAWADAEIRAEYACAGFIYRRYDIAEALERIVDPCVVSFSCYMWTIEYNKLLARAVKERYPDCLILFGGHEISPQSDLSVYPYVDVFTFGEGEIPFKELLLALKNGAPLTAVPNSAVRTDGGLVFTHKETYTALEYPSPYTAGVFDAIIAENPGVEFDVTVETNRGCPYMCAYCDWCYTPKVREFPMEKVRSEIDWCAAHKIDYVYCADANFGILPRDYDIARYVVEVNHRTGYPHIFNACFAKNSNDNVFRISKLLYDNHINKAITLAYQTVCENALRNVNRTNFTMEVFADLVRRYNAYDIPTYTELILGLPGETYNSFCEGICSLIEAGQHNAMTVYGCQVFQNALMGSRAYREKYGIVTARVKQGSVHSTPVGPGEIQEYTELVIATNDMSFDDMIRAVMFCTCVQGFHHIGLLKLFAIYLRQEMNVPYLTFYRALMDYIFSAEGTFIHSVFQRFEAECRDLSNGEWTYVNSEFGDMGWYYEEGLYMEVAKHLDVFWEEIPAFLASFGIPQPVFGELCRFQKTMMRRLGQASVTERFSYDFTSYFTGALERKPVPLKKIDNTVNITVPDPVYNWHDFSRRVMLFAKKKSGTLLFKDPQNTVSVVYGDVPAQKNVYMVQINNVYGSRRKSTYLPYAVGCIQAYCMQDPVIREHFRFGRIIYMREDIDSIIARLDSPYMVLFSCSVWNIEFNKVLAARIKQAYPDCYITFGGHSVTPDGALMPEHPYVDFVTHGAGEEVTCRLLKSLVLHEPLNDVPNLSFRSENGIVTTQLTPVNASDYPSPYLAGIFDALLEEDIDYSVIIETNRGCPFSCSYCDWGQLHCKVVLFPLERIYAEIDWLVQHKIEYVYCADANFCLFDRDEKIVDYFIECNKKYGYPKIFRVSFTKNRTEFVFDVSTKMMRNGIAKAQTIAIQSMDPNVLSNIGRTNMSAEHFRSLMRRFNENHISTYSELILGLPGETRTGFCRGICSLIENGQHFAIYVFPLQVLPNAEIAQPAYREKYQIKSTNIPFLLIHTNEAENPGEVTEYSEMVTSTASMSRMDWAQSLLFSNFVLGLHNLGLTRCLSIFLRHTEQFSYESFYLGLIGYAASHPETVIGEIYRHINALCIGVSEGKNALAVGCPDTDGILWSFEEIVCIEAIRRIDRFFEELYAWITSLFPASPVLDAVFRYQYDIIKKPGQSSAEILSDYDFYSFFQSIYLNEPKPLEKQKIRLTVPRCSCQNTFPEYARVVIWYGRNRQETDFTSHYYGIRYEKL